MASKTKHKQTKMASNMNEVYISKQQTQQLKGIAILLMLWLHLFMNMEKCAGLSSMLTINSLPLCHYMSRFSGACVSMYVFMSGYGLWIVYRRGKGMHNLRRIASLYALVTLVALLFFPWHTIANPQLKWTFGIREIVSNISGFDTYNGEWWFLFPYVVTMLISPLIFKLMARSPWCTTAAGIVVSLASTATFVILLHYVWGQALYSTYRAVEELLVVGEFMMPFCVGALCAKTGVLKQLSTCARKYKLLLLGVLILVLMGQMTVNVNSLNGIIGILFCLTGVCCNSDFLTKMGGGKHGNVALPYIFLHLLLL